MKKILELKLKFLAKAIIKKYRPLVIAITGSMGKTSAKEAVYTVIKNKEVTRRTEGNYNNEIGLPLSVIGMETGGKSLVKWIKIFFKALKFILIKDKKYPKILILEMGAEKPKDISYLKKIAPVDIGIITGIAPVHVEFFGNMENVIKEKISLIDDFNNGKIAIINIDDENIKQNLPKVSSKIITYGFTETADYRALDYKITSKNGNFGTLFKFYNQGTTIPVFLPNVFGKSQIYAALAALATAGSLNLNLLDAVDELAVKYIMPKGRTNIIQGIKNTLLIDDTYNSSPVSATAALEVLDQFPNPEGRKLAVFGEMLELGNYTEEGHKEVGRKAFEAGVEMLVAVGEKARDILRGAIEFGLPEEKTFYFNNNHDAGLFVQNKLRENDLVLIKGSQGARMEQIARELMAEPLKAKDLLVRQSDKWLKK